MNKTLQEYFDGLPTSKAPETPEQKIDRLELELKTLYEDKNYYRDKADTLERTLHNLLTLLGNPWIKIENIKD